MGNPGRQASYPMQREEGGGDSGPGPATWLPEDEAASSCRGASPQPWHLPTAPTRPGCGHCGDTGREDTCVHAGTPRGHTHSGPRLLRHTETARRGPQGEWGGAWLPAKSALKSPHPQPAPGGAAEHAGGPGGCRWCPGRGEGVLTGSPATGRTPGDSAFGPCGPGDRPPLSWRSGALCWRRPVAQPVRFPLQLTEGPPCNSQKVPCLASGAGEPRRVPAEGTLPHLSL